MSENALITPEKGAVAVSEDLLQALGMTAEQLAVAGTMGLENARPEDFQIPRLQIAQAMSPQMVRSKPEYIPNLMVGQWFNTVTGQIYGDSVQVVPIKYSVSRLRFVDKAVDCRSQNGIEGAHSPVHVGGCAKCKYSAWGSGKDGKGTDCKEYRNWLIIDAVEGSPISLSFKSSSLVVAKQWATLIAGRKILVNGVKADAPAFLTVYELRTVEKSTAMGTFFVPVVRVVGPAPSGLVKVASNLFKTFKGEIVDNAADHEE
jgi:hypothetical protein